MVQIEFNTIFKNLRRDSTTEEHKYLFAEVTWRLMFIDHLMNNYILMTKNKWNRNSETRIRFQSKLSQCNGGSIRLQFKGGLAGVGWTENQIFDGNKGDTDLETQPVFF